MEGGVDKTNFEMVGEWRKSGLKPHVICDRFLTSSFEFFNKGVFHLI